MQPVGLPAGLGRRTAARAPHHFLEGDLTKAGCGPVVRHADEGGSFLLLEPTTHTPQQALRRQVAPDARREARLAEGLPHGRGRSWERMRRKALATSKTSMGRRPHGLSGGGKTRAGAALAEEVGGGSAIRAGGEEAAAKGRGRGGRRGRCTG
jgi:hypothetical protein